MYAKSITLLLVLIFTQQCLLVTLASDPDPMQDFCIPNPITSDSTRTSKRTILQCKNSTQVTTDDFVFSGMKTAGNYSETGLASIPVNPTNFPGLNTLGMSFIRADFKAGAINPPHSHPRATEITLVVQGSVYAGFVDSGNRVFARVLKQGEVMVFPRGLVHFHMNVGDDIATVFGSFNSQNPGSQKIPAAIFGSGIEEELLVKAFGLSLNEIGAMRRRLDPKRI